LAEVTVAAAKGRRILVVEDEFLIALDLAYALEDIGAEVVGPVATVDAALAVVHSSETLHGATLDVTLGREVSFPVAEALQQRGLPFVLLTGYSDDALPPHLRDVPRCDKPFDVTKIVTALFS
jgi:ActR/RegA family two-component response regulator